MAKRKGKRKVDLTEDQWKMQIDAAFGAGMSMARSVEYHLVMDERDAVIMYLAKFIDSRGLIVISQSDIEAIKDGKHKIAWLDNNDDE